MRRYVSPLRGLVLLCVLVPGASLTVRLLLSPTEETLSARALARARGGDNNTAFLMTGDCANFNLPPPPGVAYNQCAKAYEAWECERCGDTTPLTVVYPQQGASPSYYWNQTHDCTGDQFVGDCELLSGTTVYYCNYDPRLFCAGCCTYAAEIYQTQ